jgi:hypothetical protein
MSARGVSIVEAMISLAVLGVALLTAIGALQYAALETRAGQNRQHKMMLADAALQRMKLQDKALFFSSLAPQPSVDVKGLAVGASPWARDTSVTADPYDFSQGSYFRILPDGTMSAVTLAGNPPCDAVPEGIICREVLAHSGAPYLGTNIGAVLAPGSKVATAWVRIARRPSPGQPVEADVVMSQVVVQ